MPIHHPIAACFPSLHQPHDRPFYCNNILMFSVKLVLVCDQVLIQSWNLCENGYWDNLHIEHIGYNGFYVQARVD
jgi:hypothetical protein